MNATESLDQSRERRQEDFLNIRIAEFMKRYRPDDSREAYEFEAMLIGIVRECHVQATRPFMRRLEAYDTITLNGAMLNPMETVK